MKFSDLARVNTVFYKKNPGFLYAIVGLDTYNKTVDLCLSRQHWKTHRPPSIKGVPLNEISLEDKNER